MVISYIVVRLVIYDAMVSLHILCLFIFVIIICSSLLCRAYVTCYISHSILLGSASYI